MATKIEPIRELKAGQEYWQVGYSRWSYLAPQKITCCKDKDVSVMDYNFFFHTEPDPRQWIQEQIKPKQWIPEERQKYWFWDIMHNEADYISFWTEDSFDLNNFKIGNVHKTRENCKEWAKKPYKTNVAYLSGMFQDGDLVRSNHGIEPYGDYLDGNDVNIITNAEYLQYLEEQNERNEAKEHLIKEGILKVQDVPRDKYGKELKVGDWVTGENVGLLIQVIDIRYDMDTDSETPSKLWYLKDSTGKWHAYPNHKIKLTPESVMGFLGWDQKGGENG